jgi:hypothetical protein
MSTIPFSCGFAFSFSSIENRADEKAMTTFTVANVERGDNGLTQVSPVSASAAKPRACWPVVIWSMLTVAAATGLMWVAYSHWLRPGVIQIKSSHVPFAGLIVVTAGLERLLEPLSQVLMPRYSSAASPKRTAARSKSEAQRAAADPATSITDVQLRTRQAAADQAVADARRTERAIIFWAIASICGLGISGGFGFFLLQSVASSHVNTVLDLAVTGLAIGAGTKPVHDLITSIQSKAASGG